MKNEERNLWERYARGDQQALEKLLMYHMGLVAFWVNEVASLAPWADRQDLRQEGMIALVKAIQKFDLSMGNEFSTYARYWIREALHDYLQASRNVTAYRYEQIRKVKQAQEALMRKLERKPTIAEIAEETELTEQQVETALDAMAITNAEELLVTDTELPQSSATVESPENIILIRELMLQLNDRERWVLTNYYMLGYTDPEVAKPLKLTKDNVKAIRNRALKKLAKLLEAKPGGEHDEN
jgi:RNA polymerase sigma factor (sigma-70 family)